MVTAAGASLVFLTKEINPKVMDSMLGFAAGVMIAASFWSLLAPGIQMADEMGFNSWLTAMQEILPFALCFAAGAMIFVVVEELIPESQRNQKNIDIVTMVYPSGYQISHVFGLLKNCSWSFVTLAVVHQFYYS